MARALSERGIHVVLYDQRSAGKSGHPWGPEGYGIENLANEMVHVIDTVAPRKNVSVYGGTWRVFIASEYASMYPDSHRISNIFSIGRPSFDLAAQALIDQTRLSPRSIECQECNIPVALLILSTSNSASSRPRDIGSNPAPQFFTEEVPKALRALHDKYLDMLADILGSPLARQLLYNFGDNWNANDEAHGEQKYQAYWAEHSGVDHRKNVLAISAGG